MTATLTAWSIPHYGAPNVLTPVSRPIPNTGPGEVLIRIRASAVSRADGMMRAGTPRFARLFLGLRRPRHDLVGTCLSGEIIAIGPGVSRFAVGDDVFGLAGLNFGANASHICLSETDVLMPKPASPRPAAGQKPSDIAAAAMKSVAAPTRPAPAAKPAAPAPIPAHATNGATSAPKPNAPNIADLVAKASASASRRNGVAPPPRAPAPLPPSPSARPAQPAIPDFASSSDRLRAMIEDIEAAARRAETYKPRR
jgi:hypothetical protein